MIQSGHGNAWLRFDLVNSDFHILMLRSMFQNQSLTRNGPLFHTYYVILLLTLNKIVLLCKTMYLCVTLIIRSQTVSTSIKNSLERGPVLELG